MERVSRESILEVAGVNIRRYTMNVRGFKFLEICALLLFFIAGINYPLTHFEPREWIVLSIVTILGGMVLLGMVFFWRYFSSRSFLAYDSEYFYICRFNKAVRISWHLMDVKNTSLSESADTKPGRYLFRIGGQEMMMCLFNPFVWIDGFPEVLGIILQHIKENQTRLSDS